MTTPDASIRSIWQAIHTIRLILLIDLLIGVLWIVYGDSAKQPALSGGPRPDLGNGMVPPSAGLPYIHLNAILFGILLTAFAGLTLLLTFGRQDTLTRVGVLAVTSLWVMWVVLYSIDRPFSRWAFVGLIVAISLVGRMRAVWSATPITAPRARAGSI